MKERSITKSCITLSCSPWSAVYGCFTLDRARARSYRFVIAIWHLPNSSTLRASERASESQR
eukprot:3325609-Rhodomonas_salina.3